MIEYKKRERLQQLLQLGDIAKAHRRYLELGGTQHVSALQKFIVGQRPFHKDGWIMYQALMETVNERLTKNPISHKVIQELEQRLAL
jgi:hypothetical protein